MQVKRPAFMKGRAQRCSLIWDKALGDFVPRSEYRTKAAGGIQVIPDIKPYKSVTGEVIGGRKQHRDFLRAHGLVEVGNETPSAAPKPKMPDVRHDVKAALDMVRSGYRPGPVGAFRNE